MMTKPPTVIISIPGTQESREWPLDEALAAIDRGEIAQDQWAWSAAENEWKPVAELPELELRFSQRLMGVVPPDEEPVVPVVAPTPVPKVKWARSHKVEEEESGFGFFKVFILVLALAILGILGANYGLIDQPLRMNLTQTKFPSVPVHAHLGAFCQTNALVIHLLPTTAVGPNQLADFLVNLAKSTPPEPLDGKPFANIGLTPGWTSQYIISGDDWATLGKMENASAQEKKAFILDHLLYPNGAPLLSSTKITDADALARRRDQAWASLSAALYHS